MQGEIQMRLSWPVPSLGLQYAFVLTLSHAVIPCCLKTQNNFVEFLRSIISPCHVLLIFSAEDGFVLFQSHWTKLSPLGLIHHQQPWKYFYAVPNTVNVQFKHSYLCSPRPSHTYKHVYINIWVHTNINQLKYSSIMFFFKNNFSQWHCKISLAHNQEPAPAQIPVAELLL